MSLIKYKNSNAQFFNHMCLIEYWLFITIDQISCNEKYILLYNQIYTHLPTTCFI